MTVDERLQFLLTSTESLHANSLELHATARLHSEQLKQDAEAIRALVRIAEAR